ncbi:MAG: hypothetical protein ACLQVI_33410 [Polyangiaceae bacterium]
MRPVYSAYRRVDPALYALWAAACTILCARAFYLYLLKQTGGEWSAPLDDVFIHFDFARSTARGHPFEWVEGNGYSSGNTSILYPFVLAFGYWVGFRDLRLMVWAAIVAAVCVFGTLLAARRLFLQGEAEERALAPRLLSYLLPPLFLGVGALDWTLWSGMEVALFLAIWAVSLLAFLALDEAPPGTRKRRKRAWLLGVCGALMVITRPEAVTTIAVFGLACAVTRVRRGDLLATTAELGRIALPPLLVLALQSLANRAFTGEWSANGALVKLAINNPYFGVDEKIDDYIFNLRYALLRNVEYHFADVADFGVILPGLAAAGVASKLTRRMSSILMAQSASWLALVALNGQVRWQNERYTMPAVAWLIMAAALGVMALVRKDPRAKPTFFVAAILGALVVQLYGVVIRPPNTTPELRYTWRFALELAAAAAILLRIRPVRVLAAAAALVLFHDHQASKMRDQRWFFGRASRNIRDQHVTTGRTLRDALYPLLPKGDGSFRMGRAQRMLLGDAGAIPYASDTPALDIIGLGGFHRFPFARAGVNGLASTIELMEYMPPPERPDVLVLYPSWWGSLPTLFSDAVLARFPVEGNVICGGYEDVVYRADWHLLNTGNDPREAPQGEAVKDEVDQADVLSERRHEYSFVHGDNGWTEMKVLADPADATKDMLDGGRRFEAGKSERFTLRKLAANERAHLVIRTTPEKETTVRVLVGGAEIERLPLAGVESWVERVVAVPEDKVGEEIDVTLANDGPGDFVDYHVWVTQ